MSHAWEAVYSLSAGKPATKNLPLRRSLIANARFSRFSVQSRQDHCKPNLRICYKGDPVKAEDLKPNIILTEEKLKLLETTPDTEPFDGDSKMFRLGIEAMRLALAFEYDPYFCEN